MSHADAETRFPWLPTLAPLVTAIALWLVTGSALSLLFGAMSPVMFLVQFFENRIHARRRREREARERLSLRIAEQATRYAEHAQQEERRREQIEVENRAHPSAKVLRDLIHIARRTPAQSGASQLIRLGVDESGAPLRVDARDGIRVVGRTVARRDVLRAATAQLWWITGDINQSVSDGDSRRNVGAHAGILEHASRWLVTVVSASEAHILDRDSPAQPAIAFTPDCLSATDLAFVRHTLGERHEESNPRDESGRDFSVDVGNTREGVPFAIDLMADGPHAAISGMTGSGKTSFLVRWLAELSRRAQPPGVETVVIDFKGGIDIAPLAELAQCVGFATDLDEGHIDRAFVGLQAEIQRRERLLRHGTPLSEVPRLVIVLDEFRATSRAHPLAISVVTDIAARGRALGMHLVLSSQRAMSSFSEDILANVSLRVAFRALTAQESSYLVGDARAHTHLRACGEAVVARGGAPGVVVAMHAPDAPAVAMPALPLAADRLVVQHPRRDRCVWMPPLPTLISRADAQRYPAGEQETDAEIDRGFCIGLADAPRRQRWESAWYSPRIDGHLLVTGTPHSGRSMAVRSLVEAASQRSGASPTLEIADEFQLWDWLDPRCRDPGSSIAYETEGSPPRLVTIDGIERVFGNLMQEDRDVLHERLTRTLRMGVGARLVMTCDAESAWTSRLAPLCGARLELCGAHQPGRARWKEQWIQVPRPELRTPTGESPKPNSNQEPVSNPEPVSKPVPTRMPTNGEFVQRTVVIDSVGNGVGNSMVNSTVSGIDVIAHATVHEWCERIPEFTAVTRDAAILVRGEIAPSDERFLLRRFAPVPPMAVGQGILLLPDGGYHRIST